MLAELNVVSDAGNSNVLIWDLGFDITAISPSWLYGTVSAGVLGKFPSSLADTWVKKK